MSRRPQHCPLAAHLLPSELCGGLLRGWTLRERLQTLANMRKPRRPIPAQRMWRDANFEASVAVAVLTWRHLETDRFPQSRHQPFAQNGGLPDLSHVQTDVARKLAFRQY